MSTGVDVPRGQSLRARLLVLEVGPDEVDWERLTTCQRDAADGLDAMALAGFVRWLAPRYEAMRTALPTQRRRGSVSRLRLRLLTDGPRRS